VHFEVRKNKTSDNQCSGRGSVLLGLEALGLASLEVNVQPWNQYLKSGRRATSMFCWVGRNSIERHRKMVTLLRGKKR
jgi:hypothetical protein